jgi:hypothetical protein
MAASSDLCTSSTRASVVWLADLTATFGIASQLYSDQGGMASMTKVT